MNVEIVTPEKVLYSGEADMLIARGTEGEVGIMEWHEPFLITLDYGEMRLYDGEKVAERFAIFGGFMEVRDNIVSVLSDDAESASDINKEVALVDYDKWRATEIDDDDEAGQAALRRATIRYQVASM